jgi:hypothetical protein
VRGFPGRAEREDAHAEIRVLHSHEGMWKSGKQEKESRRRTVRSPAKAGVRLNPVPFLPAFLGSTSPQVDNLEIRESGKEPPPKGTGGQDVGFACTYKG